MYQVPNVSNSEMMDLNALVDMIDADRQSEHRILTPCFLYGRFGSNVTGDEDDLLEMRRICDEKFMVKRGCDG